MTRTSDQLDALLSSLFKEQEARKPAVRQIRTLRHPAGPPVAPIVEPAKVEVASVTKEKPEILLEDQPLFSEKHPQAFKATRVLLPRISPLIVVLWLTYAIMANLVRGDYWFAYRWFHDNSLLQAFIRIASSKSELELWFSQYGTLAIMIMLVTVMAALVIHRFAWRFLFKDYIRFTEGVETAEGRAYWVEGQGFWFNLWDSWYGRRVEKRAVQRYVDGWISKAKGIGASRKQQKRIRLSASQKALESLKGRSLYHPERREIMVYLKSRRWPLVPNPVNPGRSLLKCKLTAGTSEKVERRGPYELIVHEGKYRRIVGIRAFATHNEPYSSAEIPTSQASRIFKLRIKQLIADTNELSKANPKVRLEKLKSGTVLVDPEIMEMIKNERQEKTRT